MPWMRMWKKNECEGKLNENCLISEIEFAGKQTEEINRIKFFYDILHKSNQIEFINIKSNCIHCTHFNNNFILANAGKCW